MLVVKKYLRYINDIRGMNINITEFTKDCKTVFLREFLYIAVKLIFESLCYKVKTDEMQ